MRIGRGSEIGAHHATIAPVRRVRIEHVLVIKLVEAGVDFWFDRMRHGRKARCCCFTVAPHRASEYLQTSVAGETRCEGFTQDFGLLEAQRRYLRGLAHGLRPCVHVGGDGVSTAVLAELSGALERHELLKVKIRTANREERDKAIDTLVQGSGAVLVSRIGNIALVYRPSSGERRISLPPGRKSSG